MNSSSNKVILHLQLDTLKPFLCEAVGEGYLGRMVRALQEAGGMRWRHASVGRESDRGGTAGRLYTRKSRKQHRKWLSQQLQHNPTTPTKERTRDDTTDGPYHACGSHTREVEEEVNSLSLSSPVLQEPLGVLHLSSHAHRSRAANEANCIQLALDRLRRVEEGVLAAGRKEAILVAERARQARSQRWIQRPRGIDSKTSGEKTAKESEKEKVETNRGESTWETRSPTEDHLPATHHQREGERNGRSGEETASRHIPDPTTTTPATDNRTPYRTKTNEVWQKKNPPSDGNARFPATPSSSSTSTCEGGESAARRAQPSFFFSSSFSSYLTKQKKKRREKGALRVAQRAARTGKW